MNKEKVKSLSSGDTFYHLATATTTTVATEERGKRNAFIKSMRVIRSSIFSISENLFNILLNSTSSSKRFYVAFEECVCVCVLYRRFSKEIPSEHRTHIRTPQMHCVFGYNVMGSCCFFFVTTNAIISPEPLDRNRVV